MDFLPCAFAYSVIAVGCVVSQLEKVCGNFGNNDHVVCIVNFLFYLVKVCRSVTKCLKIYFSADDVICDHTSHTKCEARSFVVVCTKQKHFLSCLRFQRQNIVVIFDNGNSLGRNISLNVTILFQNQPARLQRQSFSS